MSPDARLTELLGLAFAQAPAAEANPQIAAVRDRILRERGSAINYEVNLIGKPYAHLETVVLPRLALYLRSKRLNVRSCAPVFLSLFFGQTLYFLHASDFLSFAQAQLGLDDEAFWARAQVWERTGRSATALLPG